MVNLLLRFALLSISINLSLQNSAFSQYAEKTDDMPTISCVGVSNAKSTVHCFGTCVTKMDYFYMFSHNKNDESCVCCKERSGRELAGRNWKSYIPPPCPGGYTLYPYEYYEVCLKYVDTGKTYPDAVKHCNEDGGDLIRLDSQKKFEMFTARLETHVAKNAVQVWVQSEEHETEWEFHDGTLFSNACPISQSNAVKGNHLRYKSSAKQCVDAPPTDTHQYMCEIYRRFSHPH